MKRHFVFLLTIIFCANGLFAQIQSETDSILKVILERDGIKCEHGYIVPGEIIGKDTLLYVYLRQIIVMPPREFTSKKEHRQYNRLVQYVKKVYPYSQIIKLKFQEINQNVNTFKTKKEQREYIDKVGKELKVEFEGQLRKLTFTQGLILIKLVDRETGETSYEIIKELKGSLTAFFWQSVARLFSSNLKAEYDAEGDDKMIEEIVIRLENGQL